MAYWIRGGEKGGGAMHRRYWLLPLLLVLIACPGLRPTPTAASPDDQLISQVRVVHALPGGPSLDVFVDGARILTGLAFGAATAYLTLPAAAHEIALVPAGALVAAALVNTQLTLAPGQPYTVVALASPPRSLVLQDDRFAPIGSPARIRFVQASPDTPPLDVAVVDGPILFPNVAFGDATSYIDLPPGAQNLVLRQADTSTEVLALQDVVLTVGTVYTLVATTSVLSGAPRFSVVALVDS
jgi:hypothetical protein